MDNKFSINSNTLYVRDNLNEDEIKLFKEYKYIVDKIDELEKLINNKQLFDTFDDDEKHNIHQQFISMGSYKFYLQCRCKNRKILLKKQI